MLNTANETIILENLQNIDIIITKEEWENQSDDCKNIIMQCMDFYNKSFEFLSEEENDDFEWRYRKDKYGLGIFEGKFSLRTKGCIKDSIKDSIRWLIQVLMKISFSNYSECEIIINSVKYAIPKVIDHICRLSNNNERCVYLKMIYLSGNNTKKAVSLKNLKEFFKDKYEADNYCYFYEIFECDKQNPECHKVCANNIPLEETLRILGEKNIIVEYTDGYFIT